MSVSASGLAFALDAFGEVLNFYVIGKVLSGEVSYTQTGLKEEQLDSTFCPFQKVCTLTQLSVRVYEWAELQSY